MRQTITNQLRYRSPNKSDGAKLWRLVKDSGKLDLNTPYFYITMSHWFSHSCMLVEEIKSDRLIGAIIGFREPTNHDTLFIWQIAVAKEYRGNGIAQKLLDELVSQSNPLYVEATISPSNASSRRLFEKWAAMRNARTVKGEGFGVDLFSEQAHEEEDLYRIGPLQKI